MNYQYSTHRSKSCRKSALVATARVVGLVLRVIGVGATVIVGSALIVLASTSGVRIGVVGVPGVVAVVVLGVIVTTSVAGRVVSFSERHYVLPTS